MPHRVTATVAAYLARLELDAELVSVDALVRLHRAHVARVPYETLWIHLDEGWGIGVEESMQRIATTRRGGYCFHLNGAFSELLGALGYNVACHVGGVHGPDGATQHDLTNHLVLTVRDLVSDDNPGGTWYVDVGLGDALYEPLPLIVGEYRQGPFQLALEETDGVVGDWHLTHDERGSFSGMTWCAARTEMGAFVERNEWLSTSTESGFVKWLVLQRRDATGVDILRGLALSRVGSGTMERYIDSKQNLAEVLCDTFGFDEATTSSDAFDALWQRADIAHKIWQDRTDT